MEFLKSITEAWRALLGSPAEGQPLLLLSGVALLATVIFGSLLFRSIFKSQASGLLLMVAGLLALATWPAGWAAVDTWLLPAVADPAYHSVLRMAGALLAWLLIGYPLAKALAGIGWGATFSALLLLLAATAGCVVMARYGLAAVEHGRQSAEEAKPREIPGD